MNVTEFETIDSTNSEMRRRIESGIARPEPGECSMILARHQTGGRGRKGRVFESCDATGIYMTVAFLTGKSAEGALAVTSAVGVIVARAIRKYTGLEAQIKWVNDIYIGDRKVCGILAEGCFPLDMPGKMYIIVGVGINLSSERLSRDVREIAGGIAEDLDRDGREKLRSDLIREISSEIEKYSNCESFESFYDDYLSFSNCIGKEIVYTDGNGQFEGRAVGIDPNGALLVEHDDRIEVLNTGEITLRIKKG